MIRKSLVISLVVLFATVAYGGQYTVTPETLGLWHMDENSGSVIGDTTTYGNDGTFAGTVLPTWGGVGVQTTSYFNTDSDDGSCGIEFDSALLNRSSWTLEMRVKWDGVTPGPIPTEPAFLGDLVSDTDHPYQNTYARAHVDDSNTSELKASLDFGVRTYVEWSQIYTYGTEYSLRSGQWHDVAFAADWNTLFENQLWTAIIVDGKLAASRLSGVPPVFLGGNMVIGKGRN